MSLNLRSLLFALLILLLLTIRPALALETSYTVSLKRPWTHLIEVEMRVTGTTAGQPTELAMPVWTPGSYMVREYSRHVQEFEVVGPTGTSIYWRKIRKNIWRVDSRQVTAFTIRYKVYANELTVRTNEFNDTHAFWNNAGLLFHVVGAMNAPATVTVVPMSGWTVATGMEPVPNKPNTFHAPDVDTLYDCPFLVGQLVEVPFTVRNIPHRIVLDGKANYDKEQLRDGVQRIVEAAADLMGEIPYPHYTFLVYLRPGGGGGLEHKTSTALGVSPNMFNSTFGYAGFFSLAAHEFFHAWNVKRIKPDALGPFDYDNETYTRLLWVAEGVTSYYEDILLLRAGLTSAAQFRNSMSGSIRSLESIPGRKLMSLEEASFDAWIKEYRPDENSINTQISYYTKGSVVGMLLDLTIRGKTNGAKSLDDVMRVLWTDYAKKNKNYTPEDFQKVCEQVAGGSLDTFFAKSVRGRDDLDYDTAFAYVGLRLVRQSRTADPEPFFGALLGPDTLGAKVSAVPSDTPAYEQGISANDIIIAVDDIRVPSADFLNNYISDKNPNDTIRLTLFRGDALRTIPIKLAGRVRSSFLLTTVDSPTDLQRRLLRDWVRGGGEN